MIALLLALAVTGRAHATYAEASAGNLHVVVDGYESGERRGDHPHQVFVAVAGSDGRELSRIELTKYLAQDGEVAEVRAVVNLFEMTRAGDFADVVLWSRLSGKESMSSATDLFFRLGRGNLTFIGALKETEAFARSGWSSVEQTKSVISATVDAVTWTRQQRSAKRTRPEDPLRVTCRTTRTTYRLQNGRLTFSNAPAGKIGLTVLPRLPLKEIVPCCNGCGIAD